VDHRTLRINNDKDHVRFDANIKQNRVDVVRDKEQIEHLWKEINKFKDASVSWGSTNKSGGDGGQSLGKVVG